MINKEKIFLRVKPKSYGMKTYHYSSYTRISIHLLNQWHRHTTDGVPRIMHPVFHSNATY